MQKLTYTATVLSMLFLSSCRTSNSARMPSEEPRNNTLTETHIETRPLASSSAMSSASGESTITEPMKAPSKAGKEYWHYKSSNLGFSIDLPRTIFLRTEVPAVVAAAIEDLPNRRLFLTAKEYYVPPDFVHAEKTIVNTFTDPKTSDLVPYWEIRIEKVLKEQGLTTIIKEVFGKGCMVAKKDPTTQGGVSAITVKAQDDQSFEDCPINEGIVMRYQPSKQRVAYWRLGQDRRFVSDANATTVYDTHMIESFRME